MSLREEQCKKVCRILDDVLANRPTERDSLIVAVRKAFDALTSVEPKKMHWNKKMSIRHINGAVCYIPRWHCPNCDLEYDPAFAQRVKFCYACGQLIEGLVDDVNEVTE